MSPFLSGHNVLSGNVTTYRYYDAYIQEKRYDVITHACLKFNGSVAKPLLNLGHEWVITYTFRNLNGCTVEVWERISHYILCRTNDVN